MDKNLLAYCRYYKGEKVNPYEGKNQNKAMFWFYEMSWVNESSKSEPNFSDTLTEYLNRGFANFNYNDGVPITLKALLFNRFEHWNEGGGFEDWYKTQYIGE